MKNSKLEFSVNGTVVQVWENDAIIASVDFSEYEYRDAQEKMADFLAFFLAANRKNLDPEEN